MYGIKPGYVLGFHGCDETLRNKVVSKKGIVLEPSKNDYDWLGRGVYFWENNYSRALGFAKYLSKNRPHNKKQNIKKPSVIGAIIDLGDCCDLLDSKYLEEHKIAFNTLKATHDLFEVEIPSNVPLKKNGDLLLRHLDCAVTETANKLKKKVTGKEYDSVRGVFFEGKNLYKNAGFKSKNHIQIAVRNPNCIKGYFIPRSKDNIYP